MDQTDPAPMKEEVATPDRACPPEPASPPPRRETLAAARGLVNGIIFTIGLWLALTGLVVLIFFH